MVHDDDEMIAVVKEAAGFNFAAASVGREIHRQILDLVLDGAIKPVVGSVVDFDDIPAALTRLANRETVGRVVALLPS